MNETTERKFYLKQFKAISNAISTYEDFNLLVNHLVEGMCRTFKIKGASIMILDELENQLFRVSSYGISDHYLKKGPVFVDTKYRSMSTGDVVIIKDMQNDSRIQYPEAAKEEGIVSLMAIPIKYRKYCCVGEMRLYYDHPIMMHDEDIDSLHVLANHLGLVIECNGLKNFAEQIKTSIDSLPQRMFKG